MADRWWRRLWGGSSAARAGVESAEFAAWRARVRAEVAGAAPERVQALLLERDALGLGEEETEIEVERLHARLDVLALEALLAAGHVPEVTTQHKALGGDRCHFLAPAVWCAASGDAPGKLFITDRRLRFAGGPGLVIGWSAVSAAASDERDFIVALHGGIERRFRCNSYSDAGVAARLVSHLRSTAATRS